METLIGILRTISLVLLFACILLDVAVAIGFLFRKNENKAADRCFAILLLAFALTTVHHVLDLEKVYESNPRLLFMPVYFTLAFGASLFFAVKMRLFPKYRFVGTDAKHLVLPIGQLLFFIILFAFFSPEFRLGEWNREFLNPFYGGLETGLYIATFYGYLFGAYRYTQFRIADLRKKREGGRPLFEAFVLRRMLRVMIILFWVNSAYIVGDFVMEVLLKIDMNDYRGFTRLGSMTFVAMAGWAALSGLQLLSKMPYLNSSKLVFSWMKKLLKK